MFKTNQTLFTIRQEYEYGELFGTKLDAIPIETLDDFRVVTLALEAISSKAKLPKKDPSWSRLSDRIIALQDTAKHPELYAKPEHHDSFKRLLIEQVQRKVEEFKGLSLEQKTAYIENQQHEKNQTLSSHSIMASRIPPKPRPLVSIQAGEYNLLMEAQNRWRIESPLSLGQTRIIRRPSDDYFNINTFLYSLERQSNSFPYGSFF